MRWLESLAFVLLLYAIGIGVAIWAMGHDDGRQLVMVETGRE
jgi:type IV secretory pathway TrbD component